MHHEVPVVSMRLAIQSDVDPSSQGAPESNMKSLSCNYCDLAILVVIDLIVKQKIYLHVGVGRC